MEQEILHFDVFIFKVSRPMNYALLIAMKHLVFRFLVLPAVAIKNVWRIRRVGTFGLGARFMKCMEKDYNLPNWLSLKRLPFAWPHMHRCLYGSCAESHCKKQKPFSFLTFALAFNIYSRYNVCDVRRRRRPSLHVAYVPNQCTCELCCLYAAAAAIISISLYPVSAALWRCVSSAAW